MHTNDRLVQPQIFNRRSISTPFYIPDAFIKAAKGIEPTEMQIQAKKKHGNVKRGSSVIKFLKFTVTFFDDQGLTTQNEAFMRAFGTTNSSQKPITAVPQVPFAEQFTQPATATFEDEPPKKRKKVNYDLDLSGDIDDMKGQPASTTNAEQYDNVCEYNDKPFKVHIVRRRHIQSPQLPTVDPEITKYVFFPFVCRC